MWKFVCQPYGNAFSAHPTAIWAIRSLTKTHVDVYPSGRRCRGPGQIHCPHAHEHQGLLLSFLPSFLVVPAGIFHWSCVFFFLGSALPDIPLPIVSVLRSVSKCSVCFLLCFSVKCTDSCHQNTPAAMLLSQQTWRLLAYGVLTWTVLRGTLLVCTSHLNPSRTDLMSCPRALMSLVDSVPVFALQQWLR